MCKIISDEAMEKEVMTIKEEEGKVFRLPGKERFVNSRLVSICPRGNGRRTLHAA